MLDTAFRNDYGPVVSTSGPDQLTYRLRASHAVALLGPIEADLWIRSSAPDADVFVQLVDRAPDGSQSYLQRGMLRASFRAVDGSRSDRIRTGADRGQSYRPFHPFLHPKVMTPGTPVQLAIEVFPVGFVLRPGHDLLVQVYAPPFVDELNTYASGQPPAVNTILSDSAHPSSVMLPLLATLPPLSAKPPVCGSVTGVRCTAPLRR
jgi:predicted acyl esterase